jgi:hypothetical protein
MRKLFALGLIVLVAVITGCANNANIDTNETYWQHKPSTVVIVTTHTDKPQYADEYASSHGVIFQMASMVSTQKLENHLNQMDVDWYYQGLAERFQQALAKENIKAIIASEHPYLDPDVLFSNNPKLNRVQLAAEYNADQVLVLAMPFYGARIPQQPNMFAGAPPVEGACVLYAELSDPQHTTIYWRHTSIVTKPVLLNANQPPDYPNLTQNVVDSHKMAEEELLDSLRSGR